MTFLAVSSVTVTVSSLATGGSCVGVTTMLIAAGRVCLSFATLYVVEAEPLKLAAGVNV